MKEFKTHYILDRLVSSTNSQNFIFHFFRAFDSSISIGEDEHNWLMANVNVILQLKELGVTELKYYLAAHNLPVSGKKEVLISRILSHMGK